jgi:hypothetical protein
MNQLLLRVVIVVAFGAFCFGCGYLTAFIVTRNQWRDEMIKRGCRPLQLAVRQMGMGRAAAECLLLTQGVIGGWETEGPKQRGPEIEGLFRKPLSARQDIWSKCGTGRNCQQ